MLKILLLAMSARAAQVAPEAALSSMKAAFSSPKPVAQAGALLNYLQGPRAAGDPVVAALKTQAADFLTTRIPAESAARADWSERMAILNMLRADLDEGQNARVQENMANMGRHKRAEISTMIANVTKDWRFEALGIVEDAPVEIVPKSNVLPLKPSKRTAPERKLFGDADVRAFPEPPVAALLGYARTIRRELGWGKMAIHPSEHDAEGEVVREGEHAVVIEAFGNPAMIASVDLSGVMIGFGQALGEAEVKVLRAAGIPLNHAPVHPARFKTYHDEAPLKDSGWYQSWRRAFLTQ